MDGPTGGSAGPGTGDPSALSYLSHWWPGTLLSHRRVCGAQGVRLSQRSPTGVAMPPMPPSAIPDAFLGTSLGCQTLSWFIPPS